MEHDRRNNLDPMQEAMLISLDQLSQTLEVMGQVINRLRYQVEDMADTRPPTAEEADRLSPMH
ncbi:hypothetical protein L1F30_12655 [Simiduia sp. 21SJ11W-1]|uniref:hypothetical protein n=1 Tax=Simiduia sp. 21SJ11W-1 TaxID=2909669 RepID=UPI00209F69CF|nr:hypothetical protein [Simiduia sp. 21SJ11W-1]UTA47012.1 hypothetical protein L1F30_12655 [Simiduia sp. 21SJ11W-1]